MEVGDTVKIWHKKCDSRPEIMGENADIVDLQMQEYEKYRQFPIWVKMTSGEHKGKIYGFREHEVEILPTRVVEGGRVS